MFDALSAVVALGLAAVTILGCRSPRGGVPLPVLLLALAAASGGAHIAMHWPLLGWAFTGSLLLLPITLALSVAYVAIIALFRRSFAPVAASRWILLVPVTVLLGVLLVVGVSVGRGRPEPGSLLASCTRASFAGGYQPDLAMAEQSSRVTGVHMSWDTETHNATGCSLTVTTMSGATETLPLAPPWGVSGSYRCGTGEAFLCRNVGLLFVEELPAGPLSTREVHAVRLLSPLHHVTPTPAGIGSDLAPPRKFVWLAAVGLFVAIVGALIGHRRRVGDESAEHSQHPYRTAEGRPVPQRRFIGSRWLTLHPTASAALILGMPLVASLISR